MKTNPLILIVALFTSLIIVSCSSLKVSYDYDKSVDFKKYKTYEYYGWAKESDKIINDLDKKRIEQAFANEFASRELSYVKTEGELVVTLFIVVEKKTGVTYDTQHYGGYYGRYYGYGPGWGWSSSYSTTTAREYDYNVGTLVVDVFDKASEKLIWEGVVSGTVDQNPNNHDKKIPRAVADVMYYYPVRPLSQK